MGCFSKCCAKTNLPVLMGPTWGDVAPRLTKIIVLQRGRKPFDAEYDGYGLGMDDAFDYAKFVLADAYNGERWEDLPESGHEPNQGIFHDKQFILAIAARKRGFASVDEYTDALFDYENLSEACLATAMASLDIPPPEKLYVSMLEYLDYIANKQVESAKYCLERHPEVLEWLPEDVDGAHLAQAQRVMAILDEETCKLAQTVLANYPEPA